MPDTRTGTPPGPTPHDPLFIAPPEPEPAEERTPNSRKTKRAVRALAAEMGVKYTAALRAYEAGRRPTS